MNYPENTILYINQAYLTVKKKIYYCDFFALGQIVEAVNPAGNILTCVIKENEVKMIRPKYNAETGQFLGLYETVGFMVVRESPDEVFFNFGFNKDKSKVLYLHHRTRIPNYFSGTIFNRHRAMIEAGEIDSEFSNIYFFFSYLSSIEARILMNILKRYEFLPLISL